MENKVAQVYVLGKTYLTNNEKFYIRNDPIIYMAVGDRHTIIITTSGRVYTFGDNNSGQLGLGHTDDVKKVSCIKSLKFGNTGEKVILAACGRESSLVATNQGSLYAFGSNNCSQLGIQSEKSIIIYPYPIKIEYFRTKIIWKQISMGAEHTCALTNNGEVYIWGSNEDGQCGQTRQYNIIKMPKELRLEYPIITISCGYYHTALISEDNRLFLFGNNIDKQLGCSISNPYTGPKEVSLPNPVKAVACGHQHTVVLTDKGDVYTCGRGKYGQLGLGSGVLIAEQFEIIKNLPKHLTAVAAGETHTAIIDSHGNLYLFGDSKHGKLSNEIDSNKFEPCLINQFKEYFISNVVCGGCQTIILAQERSIENDENIKNITNKSIKNIVHTTNDLIMNTHSDTSLQFIESFEISNKKNYSKYPSSHTDLNDDSVELLTPMNNLSMNTTHVKINGKSQQTENLFISTNFHTDNEEFQPFKVDLYEHTLSQINIRDDMTKINDDFLSSDTLPIDDIKSNYLTPKNSFRQETNSDDDSSTSGDSSISTSEYQNNSLGTNENNSNRYLTLNNLPTTKSDYQQISSDETASTNSGRTSSSVASTNSGCTSSSVSSVHSENQIISLKPIDDIQNSIHSSPIKIFDKSNIINSNINSTKNKITTESQTRFFQRILPARSSQTIIRTTNKNSKICSIM